MSKVTESRNDPAKLKLAYSVICLLTIIAVSLFVYVLYENNTAAKDKYEFISDGEKWDGSTPETSMDIGEQKTISATIYPVIYVSSKQKEVPVFNSEENSVSMIYIFKVENEEICRSLEIGPGCMDKINLYDILDKKGTYDIDVYIETKSIYTGEQCNGLHTKIEVTKY